MRKEIFESEEEVVDVILVCMTVMKAVSNSMRQFQHATTDY